MSPYLPSLLWRRDMAKKTQVTKVTDKSAFDHFAMIPNLIDNIPMSLAVTVFTVT